MGVFFAQHTKHTLTKGLCICEILIFSITFIEFRIMDRFKNYKFGDITKGLTKTEESGVAHVEEKNNDKCRDITKEGDSKTVVVSGVAHVEDKKKNDKSGAITKGERKTVGSDGSNVEDKYKFGDISKGIVKTVGSEDYKFGDITKDVTKTVGSTDYKFGDITKGLTKTEEPDVAHVEDPKDFGWLGRAK